MIADKRSSCESSPITQSPSLRVYRQPIKEKANFHIIYFIQLVSRASFKASVEGQTPPEDNSEQELI